VVPFLHHCHLHSKHLFTFSHVYEFLTNLLCCSVTPLRNNFSHIGSYLTCKSFLGQVPAHELPRGPRQHVQPIQEPSSVRQPEDRLHVRSAGQEVLPADGRAQRVRKHRRRGPVRVIILTPQSN